MKPATLPCPKCNEVCEYAARITEPWGDNLTHWTRERCRCERDADEALVIIREKRRVEGEENQRILTLRRVREQSRFEGIQWEQTFDTFDATRDQLMGDAYHMLRAWCELFIAGKTRRGYVLSAPDYDLGMYGCGKSHLVAAAGHALLAKGIGFQFYTVSDLLDEMRKDIGKKEGGKTLAAACSCDVLCLDDFGTETIRAGESGDWVREQLFLLFDRRARRGLPLLSTTNHTTQSLVERIGGVEGERIFSRLVQMAEWVEVGGQDWRLA